MRGRDAQLRTHHAAIGVGVVLAACSSVPSFADVPESDIARAPDVGARDVVPIEVAEADAPDFDCLPRITGRYCPPPPDVPTMRTDASLQPVPDAGASLPAPRLTGPVSPLGVASWRPRLHWELPAGATGAVVDLCRDRNCTRPIMRFEADGNESRPPDPIPPGVVFWRAYARDARGVSTNVSAIWEFWVRRRDTPSDAPWGVYRDFNGDGYEDVAIPAALDVGVDGESSPISIGAVYVYYGGPCGIDERPPGVLRSRQLVPNLVRYAGDVNGDGFADLLVWAGRPPPYDTDRWRIALGSPTGLDVSRMVAVDLGFLGRRATWGRSGSANDLDGDGITDLVFGVDRAFVLSGRISLDRAYALTEADDAPVYAPGGDAGWVWSAATTQRSNHGGALLLVIGTHMPFGGPLDFVGGYAFSISALTAAWEVHDPGPLLERLAGVGSGGDFDGDGEPDVRYGGTAQIRVYATGGLGAPTALASLERPAEAATAPADFGGNGRWGWQQTNAVADLNADGRTEILVAAACAPRVPPSPGQPLGCGVGRVYVYSSIGSTPGAVVSPILRLSGTRVGWEFGYSSSTADLNGDGFDDIAIASPGTLSTGDMTIGPTASSGAVEVFWGSPDNVSDARRTTISGCQARGSLGAGIMAYE